MTIAQLPSLNACLNALSILLLCCGFLAIRRRYVTVHRACMLTAFGVSSLFLVSYVIYHSQAGSVPFRGTGFIRLLRPADLTRHSGCRHRSTGADDDSSRLDKAV